MVGRIDVFETNVQGNLSGQGKNDRWEKGTRGVGSNDEFCAPVLLIFGTVGTVKFVQ